MSQTHRCCVRQPESDFAIRLLLGGLFYLYLRTRTRLRFVVLVAKL